METAVLPMGRVEESRIGDAAVHVLPEERPLVCGNEMLVPGAESGDGPGGRT